MTTRPALRAALVSGLTLADCRGGPTRTEEPGTGGGGTVAGP